MRALRAWLVRLGGLVRGGRRERELRAEIESHLQLHIDDNIRAGMTPDEARRAALVRFGPAEAIKDEYRERAGIPAIEMLVQDLRYGLRRLTRNPGSALLIAATLGIGVGANAAMLGLVDRLMFRTPAHVRDPQRIVSVSGAENYVRYEELRGRLRSVELAAYSRHTLGFGAGADAAPIRIECVTPSYFPLLGAAPRIGRGFTDADDALGAPGRIVVSHTFWSRRLGAEPGVIGTPVLVSGRTYEVIGIAPHGFTGVDLDVVDAWILIAVSPEACSFGGTNLLRESRGAWLRTVGRLRSGFSFEQAAVEAAVAGERLVEAAGRSRSRSVTVRPRYLSRRVSFSPDSRLALWLAGGAGLLLLLACANIAGLLWSGALARGREIAVRLQLGASRRRVFAQLTIESLLHAAAGGVAALAAGAWLGRAVLGFFAFSEDTVVLDARTLAVVAVLAFAAGLVSGGVPAIQAARSDPGRHLRTGQAVAGGRMRTGTVLLAGQVALALVLMAAAGLFAGSVQNFRRDFAYDLERVVAASIDLRRSPDKSPEEVHATYALLLERVRQLPQVQMAALSSAPVLRSGGSMRVFPIARRPKDPSSDFHAVIEVTPDYFPTLGLRLVAGKGFTGPDAPSGRPAVVLNATLADALFAGEDPIGQCAFIASTCYEVVGVSEPFRATIRQGSQGESHAFLALQTASMETAPQVLLIRTRDDAADAAGAIASVLQGASPDLPYVSVRPLVDLADAQARSWLLGATVFGLFGTMAVLLAGIGIYGALAFAIRQRTVEIGVRMALGATRRDIAGLVLRYGAVVLALGLLLGFAGAFGAARFIESLLFNVAPADPMTFAVASAVVVCAVLAGCLGSALRAARVDPAVALRYE